jgi:hypothetical protein
MESSRRFPLMRLVCAALLICAVAAHAKLVPFRLMDYLMLHSGVVVYCDEEDIQEKEIPHETAGVGGKIVKWMDVVTIVKCKVRQSFKGDLGKGREFTVTYDPIFRRYLQSGEPYTELDGSGKVIATHPAQYLPRGRTLLFLQQDDKGNYSVISAKIVQGGKVYCFTQVMNPGPLELGLQEPENFKLPKDAQYGEDELLKDAALTLQKSAALK